MAKEKDKKRVFRMPEAEGLSEPVAIPAPKQEEGKTKVHVDLYLKVTGVPLWERGGKRAFAIANKLEYAQEADFKKLFERY